MSRDPYRRAAPAPPPEKPRGTVVRRAEGPEAHDEQEKRLRNARFRAQTILAEAELENGQRKGAISGRVLGGAAIVVGLVLGGLTMSELAGGYYHPRSAGMSAAAILVGLWYLIVGVGGATSIESAPPWVKIGGVVAAVIGLAWGATGYIDILAMFVR